MALRIRRSSVAPKNSALLPSVDWAGGCVAGIVRGSDLILNLELLDLCQSKEGKMEVL
jgi:hypothetical protein